MKVVLAIPKLFWDYWLIWPVQLLKDQTGIDWTTGQALLIYKIITTIVLAIVLFELLSNWYQRIRSMLRKKHFVKPPELGGGHVVKDTEFSETLEGARDLKKTIEPLKKARDYRGIADLYASLNQPKQAAKWYSKARDRRRAAEEWARAGYTIKAARLLMREADYATAAHFYEAKDKHIEAARAYLKANDFPAAAAAFVKAGKFKEAVKAFTDYFSASVGCDKSHPAAQTSATEACLAMLESEGGRAAIPSESRMALLPVLAQRFAWAKRYDLAARLYHEAKDWAHAGEAYTLAGKLEEAAQCFHAAGKNKEANQTAARYYENAGKWPEAGAAYAHAGDWHKAGLCFSKANDAQHAAECYEKAGEAYGAGLAYSHLGRFEDALRFLQQVSETDKNFDTARGLLGRCFYELHDYAHCAAALENHLVGKRIDSANSDSFYMLALAYEQLGNLDKSREILYKIHSVSMDYRDVTQRISNISSRISIGDGIAGTSPAIPQNPDAAETHIMEMVENLLGGRYRLERELGRGGMGVVYLAFDTQLDRPVALKFLGSLADGSESYRERFIREAKAAARVSHPNIISIYDIGASQGKAYIAMEYVEGANLHAYISKKGALSPREAVNLIAQACAALDSVHKSGIVHRDVKPDNILIAKGGLVKLMDFGLAKADERITGTNIVMGTPSYMSPEQTCNSDVDARSDIYSLGLVLHEALTGKTVFAPGKDVLKRQQQEAPKPPSEMVDGIPKMLDAIVMKCIEKKPEARYQTAEELLADLRKVTS